MNHSRSKLLDLLNTDVTKLFATTAGPTAEPEASERRRWVARRSERHHPPCGATRLDGHLLDPRTGELPIVVWDLSETGACLRSTTNLGSLLNDRISLRVQNEQHNDTVDLEGVVKWVDPIAPNLFFAGVRFEGGADRIRHSFLGVYLA